MFQAIWLSLCLEFENYGVSMRKLFFALQPSSVSHHISIFMHTISINDVSWTFSTTIFNMTNYFNSDRLTKCWYFIWGDLKLYSFKRENETGACFPDLTLEKAMRVFNKYQKDSILIQIKILSLEYLQSKIKLTLWNAPCNIWSGQ